eukprot:COSAG01_NODE_43321_length_431_cov_0.536145_1_plen_40_part_10
MYLAEFFEVAHRILAEAVCVWGDLSDLIGFFSSASSEWPE